MDRGPLEKEKAQSIKLEIARSGFKRKRPRLYSTALATGIEGGSDAASDNCDRPVTQPGTALCLSKSLPKRTPTTLDDVFDDEFSLSSTPMQQTANNTMAQQMSIVVGEMSTSEILSTDESELDHCSLPVDPLLRVAYEWDSSESTLDYEAYMEIGTFLPMQTSESLPQTLHRLRDSVPSDTPSCYFGTSSGTDDSSSISAPGDILLSDAIYLSKYLEETLSAQFPFRQVSHMGCRQWLEILLFSSKHVLKATILLSGAANSVSENPDLGQEKNIGNHMFQAMNILRSLPSATSSLSLLDEKLKASHILSACTCVMQTVFLEV